MANVLIRHGLLVDTEWARHMDILIKDSVIERIAPSIEEDSVEDGTTVIDAEGLCVLPGLIDAHTHYHLVSRGTVTADSFPEGSRLAAFGGVTTVVDFADDNKVDLSDSFHLRRKEMRSMSIDYALHQGVYKWRDSIPEELKKVHDEGVNAIKIFTTYKNVGYLVEKRDELKAIFDEATKLGMQVCIHCEDDQMIQDINDNWKGTYLPKDHADMRPPEVEAAAIRYVGGIAKELGCSIYIVHLSSKLGLEAVRELRNEGVHLTVETTPHNLFLERSKLEGEKGPLYVMTPPLRTREDNLALQEAVENGEIQVVASDHCTFTYEQKLESNDVRTIYPGIPGTEEILPLLHTFGVVKGKMNLSQIVNLCSTGPAKAFGLYPKKGSLKEGTDADICLFDPDESWVIGKDTVHTAAGYSAYDGITVTGKVVMTFLRGRLIMGDDIYLGLEGDGQFLGGKR